MLLTVKMFVQRKGFSADRQVVSGRYGPQQTREAQETWLWILVFFVGIFLKPWLRICLVRKFVVIHGR